MRKTALRRRIYLRVAKMPLAEYRAPVPAGGQILRNQFFRLRQPVVGLRKIIHLDIGIRRDAVTLGETPRQQSHAGGGTHRCRHIRPGAKHALLGQPVNGRRFNLPGTSTAQIPITQVIRQNDNHVRRCGEDGAAPLPLRKTNRIESTKGALSSSCVYLRILAALSIKKPHSEIP